MTVLTRVALPADILRTLALGLLFIAVGMVIPPLVGSDPRAIPPSSGEVPLFVRLLSEAFIAYGIALMVYRLWGLQAHAHQTPASLSRFAWQATGAAILCISAGVVLLVAPPLALREFPLEDRVAKSLPAWTTAVPCLVYGLACWGRRSVAAWQALHRFPSAPGDAVWAQFARAEVNYATVTTLHQTGWEAKVENRRFALLTAPPTTDERVPAIVRHAGNTIVLLTPSGVVLGENVDPR